MAKKNLQYVSTSELKKALKRSKTLTIIQSVLVSFMLIYAVLMTIENGINPFTFLPLVFAPMIILGFIQMKKFNEELKRRENN